jgi:hypothetical protein
MKVFEWAKSGGASKEGDVSDLIDKKVNKKVIKIAGATSASNYAQIPHPKGSTKSLGLTGRFVNYHINSFRRLS